MNKVVTFGEIMLRLSPPGVERFLQSPVLSATFGGGEANVAVSLAHFGCESVYVTALPSHAIGEAALHALRAEGVRTDHIVRSGSRVGIYFAETGASQRASTVSFDLNYRRKLWTESEAQRVVGPLLKDVELVVANEEDLQSVLGIHVANTDVAAGRLAVDGFRQAAERVTTEFGPRLVAITLRESLSASDNGWSALLWDANTGTMLTSQRYEVRVVDRIGAGDSFAAGLIYGLLAGRAPADALRFAVAASALKHSIPGDFNRVTVEEVDRLARGDASGRVQR